MLPLAFVATFLLPPALPPQTSKGAEFSAVLAREITGDPKAAAKSLEVAIAKAKEPGNRARLMAKLAILYQRLNQLEKRKQILAELGKAPEPYAAWAKQQASRNEGQQGGNNAVVRLIHELDAGTKVGSSEPFYELRQLGSLAVPALIGELDKLGYFGLSNAFLVFRSYPDPALYPVLEKMLRSDDQIRRTLAARFLPNLPADARSELAAIAIASDDLEVRKEGIRALLPLANQRRDMQQRVLEMARSESPRTLEAAIDLLSDPEFGDRKLAAATLEGFVGNADPNIVIGASYAWSKVCQEGDEDRALALLARLPSLQARKPIYDVAVERLQSWTRVQKQALESEGLRNTINQLWTNQQPDFDEATWIGFLGRKSSRISALALDVLRKLRSKRATPEVVKLLDDRFLKDKAFLYLVDLAPELLQPRLSELYRDSQLQPHVSQVLPELVGPQHVPWLVELLERDYHDPSVIFKSRYLAMIARISTIEHWDLLTDLADPASERTRTFSEGNYDFVVDAVETAVRRWFAPSLIPLACERLPRMDKRLAGTVMELMWPAASGKDATSIRGLLERSLAALREGKDERWHAFGRYLDYSRLAEYAIQLLGEIKADGFGKTLMPLLVHENDAIADAAFQVLIAGDSTDQKQLFRHVLTSDVAAGLLSQVLQHDVVVTDPDLRKLAIDRLANWSGEANISSADAYVTKLSKADREAFGAKVLAREHGDNSVPSWLIVTALYAYGSLKSAKYVEAFAGYLDHADWRVRYTAVEQLGRTFSREAGPYLIEALKDDDARIAKLAKQALAKIKDYLAEKAKWEAEFGETKKK